MSGSGVLRRRAVSALGVAFAVATGLTLGAATGAPGGVPQAGAAESTWGSGEIPAPQIPDVPLPQLEVPPIDLPPVHIPPLEIPGHPPIEFPGSEGRRIAGPGAAGPAGRASPDCTVVACVALTFDDGPDRATTPALLDILSRRGAPATFFVVGQRIAGHEDILHRMTGLGMEVANHSWDHPDLTTLPEAAVTDQIVRTSDEIARVTGEQPTHVRAPGGAWPAGVVPPRDLTLTGWDVDPFDWAHRDAPTVARNTLSGVGPGDIVLLHDIHPTTVEAVPRILDGLEERGLVPVTLGELGYR